MDWKEKGATRKGSCNKSSFFSGYFFFELQKKLLGGLALTIPPLPPLSGPTTEKKNFFVASLTITNTFNQSFFSKELKKKKCKQGQMVHEKVDKENEGLCLGSI